MLSLIWLIRRKIWNLEQKCGTNITCWLNIQDFVYQVCRMQWSLLDCSCDSCLGCLLPSYWSFHSVCPRQMCHYLHWLERVQVPPKSCLIWCGCLVDLPNLEDTQGKQNVSVQNSQRKWTSEHVYKHFYFENTLHRKGLPIVKKKR